MQQSCIYKINYRGNLTATLTKSENDNNYQSIDYKSEIRHNVIHKQVHKEIYIYNISMKCKKLAISKNVKGADIDKAVMEDKGIHSSSGCGAIAV